ncbi:MAG: cbb3-type cytochrome c oxidase subunit 3 [Gammaproteobacteria bacterium]|jgi:hypothetical protein
MDSYTIILSLGVAIGVVVIIGYVALYVFSPNARKNIERPKHIMFDDDSRLWPKQDGTDK